MHRIAEMLLADDNVICVAAFFREFEVEGSFAQHQTLENRNALFISK